MKHVIFGLWVEKSEKYHEKFHGSQILFFSSENLPCVIKINVVFTDIISACLVSGIQLQKFVYLIYCISMLWIYKLRVYICEQLLLVTSLWNIGDHVWRIYFIREIWEILLPCIFIIDHAWGSVAATCLFFA